MSRVGIVLAAGSGTRLGLGHNKAWLPLAAKPLAIWSLTRLAASELIDRLVLVVAESEQSEARNALQSAVDFEVEIVVGGDSRHASEFNALTYLADDINACKVGLVLIHDAARPFVLPELIERLVVAASSHTGAVPGIAVEDAVGAEITGTLYRVQTPQAFPAKLLLDCYEAAEREGFTGTDTAACVERFQPNSDIHIVEGDRRNLKITYPQDLPVAEALLAELTS